MPHLVKPECGIFCQAVETSDFRSLLPTLPLPPAPNGRPAQQNPLFCQESEALHTSECPRKVRLPLRLPPPDSAPMPPALSAAPCGSASRARTVPGSRSPGSLSRLSPPPAKSPMTHTTHPPLGCQPLPIAANTPKPISGVKYNRTQFCCQEQSVQVKAQSSRLEECPLFGHTSRHAVCGHKQ